ncbi:L7Ae/L30e/S12e/Gadd45 family ribosomal protein [Paenibacillus turpanensis]|uniref:L7Ae/L30e/S12e/Gadd45 family ribosomal protein n=1 Tax=Paenibacillus turpanensis TaxID=2689078 RepID=UPI001A9F6309|nr:ribosomal L7Ae/L30e/S12e/Gadd45 family protein [Paenibacillus turpanensis]
MKNNANPIQTIGLAMRAGKLATGDEAVLKAVRSKTAKLVLLATDASDNARKKYKDKCSFYDVPVLEQLTREQLGQGIGKPERVVIAVTDDGFAELIRKGLRITAEVKSIE